MAAGRYVLRADWKANTNKHLRVQPIPDHRVVRGHCGGVWVVRGGQTRWLGPAAGDDGVVEGVWDLVLRVPCERQKRWGSGSRASRGHGGRCTGAGGGNAFRGMNTGEGAGAGAVGHMVVGRHSRRRTEARPQGRGAEAGPQGRGSVSGLGFSFEGSAAGFGDTRGGGGPAPRTHPPIKKGFPDPQTRLREHQTRTRRPSQDAPSATPSPPPLSRSSPTAAACSADCALFDIHDLRCSGPCHGTFLRQVPCGALDAFLIRPPRPGNAESQACIAFENCFRDGKSQ